MPFPKPGLRTPTRVESIKIILEDIPANALLGIVAQRTYRFQITVTDQTGAIIEAPILSGDLRTQLTVPQQTQLDAFLDNMRARATTELLT